MKIVYEHLKSIINYIWQLKKKNEKQNGGTQVDASTQKCYSCKK